MNCQTFSQIPHMGGKRHHYEHDQAYTATDV